MSDPELAPPVAAWLVTDEGCDHVAAVDRSLRDGDDALRVGTRLRAAGLDPARATAVMAAAAARDRARERWPDADQLLFTREGLEQASDPAISAWRARRFVSSAHVEDRAAGCGGDTLALAAAGPHVTAIDLDAGRLTLLRHNARIRGLEVSTIVGDALTTVPPASGPVHADPARRVDGRRLHRLADHRPSVPALCAHLARVRTGPGMAVVVGPGVDLDDPALPPDVELEFVQLGRRLVEAVVWTGALRHGTAQATATILDDHAAVGAAPLASRCRADRGPRLPTGPVGTVLIDVAPAAVRARLHDDLGAHVGARRIGTRRALLTADDEVPASPWWQRRRVEAVLPARPNAVRRFLRTVDERPVEVALHGMDVNAAAFRRAIGGPPAGPAGRRVELVRTDDGAIAIVTRDLDPAGGAARPGRRP